MAWEQNPPKRRKIFNNVYFGHSRQVRQADRYEYPKGIGCGLLPSGTASDKELLRGKMP